MRFKIYREYGALNSVPVFNAVEQGLRSHGQEIVSSNEDISVIWSVLWQGRMRANKSVYEKAIADKKPIMIVEVGNLFRNKTWRISLNHVNGLGIFGNKDDLDPNRPKKLNINLLPIKEKRKSSILIAGQHQNSLQWEGMPSPQQWAKEIVDEIRKKTDLPIIIRPHPRSPFSFSYRGVTVETPSKLVKTYDDFNINYDHHCVINYNAGVAVQAAIKGIPVICDSSSLASPVGDSLENIINPILPNRDQWFLELCHTEWTVDEISSGIPFERLKKFM